MLGLRHAFVESWLKVTIPVLNLYVLISMVSIYAVSYTHLDVYKRQVLGEIAPREIVLLR